MTDGELSNEDGPKATLSDGTVVRKHGAVWSPVDGDGAFHDAKRLSDGTMVYQLGARWYRDPKCEREGFHEIRARGSGYEAEIGATQYRISETGDVSEQKRTPRHATPPAGIPSSDGSPFRATDIPKTPVPWWFWFGLLVVLILAVFL